LQRTFPFFDELILDDRSSDATRVWIEALTAAGRPHDPPQKHSLVWNGDFSRELENGGLGWRWQPYLGGVIDFASAPSGHGARSVCLQFGGGTNLALAHPTQFVPVVPSHGYHFHAYIRTEDITTESGMRFSITDPNHDGAVNVISENLTGSHAWTTIELDLKSGPMTHFLLVKLMRSPSRLFDNKLAGSVWIADVSLVAGANSEAFSP
jgi:hypothetical protein